MSGAHHWARELTGLGYEIRLMPPAYVKPHVKRGKADVADAEAICEAVTRPAMRFVPVKSAERRAPPLGHVAPEVRRRRNARGFLVRQRTQTVNAMRARLSEFGIVAAKGIHDLDRLLEAARDVPAAARPALERLADQLRDLEERTWGATARVAADQMADPLARRLATIPGPGPIASSASAATTPDVAAFRSARDHAAWLGPHRVVRCEPPRLPRRRSRLGYAAAAAASICAWWAALAFAGGMFPMGSSRGDGWTSRPIRGWRTRRLRGSATGRGDG